MTYICVGPLFSLRYSFCWFCQSSLWIILPPSQFDKSGTSKKEKNQTAKRAIESAFETFQPLIRIFLFRSHLINCFLSHFLELILYHFLRLSYLATCSFEIGPHVGRHWILRLKFFVLIWFSCFFVGIKKQSREYPECVPVWGVEKAGVTQVASGQLSASSSQQVDRDVWCRTRGDRVSVTRAQQICHPMCFKAQQIIAGINWPLYLSARRSLVCALSCRFRWIQNWSNKQRSIILIDAPSYQAPFRIWMPMAHVTPMT